MISLSPKKAREAIIKILRANRFAMLIGSPGIGKSFLAQQIADSFKLLLIDLRLSQSDPTDLNGFAMLSQNQERMAFKPPEDIPLEGLDTVPAGYKGWLILFDELNSAPPSVQAAAYKVILDRKIGARKIHPAAVMMGAGNLDTDRAIVNRMGTALQSRMVHLQLQVSNDDWQEWAMDNDVDFRVRSFLRFRPELLHKFDPNHADVTYPCPRTWHMLSDIIKGTEEFDVGDLAIMQGTVGEGTGIEFNGYTKVCGSLPTIEQMENDPNSVMIPDEVSHQYAFATLIGYSMNKNNVSPLMLINAKLPLEFQVIAMKDAYQRGEGVKDHHLVRQWISTNAKKFFDS
ncbi:MAG TPA: AAA family ATPase [Candidatus Nanoarchaeia archaeon]|nr:AAA family ATPase [Candidatus Nanoarchaeia archaeon]